MSQEALGGAGIAYFGTVFLQSDSVSRKPVNTEEFVNFNLSKESTMNNIVSFHPKAQKRRIKSLIVALGQVFVSIKRRLDENASIRELSRMSDRQLRDVGIERFEISDVVRGIRATEKQVQSVGSESRPVESAVAINRRAA